MRPQGPDGLRSGGQVLVDQLLIHGADRAFCVPGESYLPVIDALYSVRDRFRLINARHEAGAAHMAAVQARLTGRPGLCLVTRGPGACHAAVGVHAARQDSVPLLLLIGQVPRTSLGREAFQEIDYRALFGGIAKWVTQIEDASRIPEIIARAHRVAASGRPGPVVVALPEDMLSDRVATADAPPWEAATPAAPADAPERIRALLQGAARPLMIVGGSGWSDAGCAAITRFAVTNGLPAACAYRRQDIVDNDAPVYVGDLGSAVAPSLVHALREADAVLAIGTRLGDITTQGYASLQSPSPLPRLIHVHPDPDELGSIFAPALGIVAGCDAIAGALADADWGLAPGWRDWAARLRAAHLAERVPDPSETGPLNMGQAMAELRALLPADAIVTLDAGNHNGWAQRYLRYGRPGRQLGSTCGTMGYGVPAAVAAALCQSDRCVVAFVGDGCFMMHGTELATASQFGVAPIVLVFDNRSYGTIRMHQERDYPGRPHATALAGEDIAQIAAGLGAHVETVRDTAAFRPAFLRARAAGRPAVLVLKTDPDQITTRTRLPASPGPA